MTTYGRWVTTPIEYADALYRYREEIGPFDFAGQQDLMCEPFVLDRVAVETGRRPTVLEHQERTVENYLALHEIAPDLPIAPTLQGWEADDYLRAVDLFTNAGVDLTEARCVGVGSVCRRQDTAEIARVLTLLNEHGLRLHGYGVKAEGLRASAWLLVSSDSMAWSYAGRRSPDPNCQRKACNNCLHYALAWRKNVLLPALRKDTQMALAV